MRENTIKQKLCTDVHSLFLMHEFNLHQIFLKCLVKHYAHYVFRNIDDIRDFQGEDKTDLIASIFADSVYYAITLVSGGLMTLEELTLFDFGVSNKLKDYLGSLNKLKKDINNRNWENLLFYEAVSLVCNLFPLKYLPSQPPHHHPQLPLHQAYVPATSPSPVLGGTPPQYPPYQLQPGQQRFRNIRQVFDRQGQQANPSQVPQQPLEQGASHQDLQQGSEGYSSNQDDGAQFTLEGRPVQSQPYRREPTLPQNLN